MALAAPTVYVAVDQALLADTAYMAVAVDRGVYAAGDVPDNQRVDNSNDVTPPTRHGYLEIGASGESTSPEESFEADASAGILTLTVRASSKKWALVIARHVRRVLHNTPLAGGLSAFTGDAQALIQGGVQLVEDFANPDGGHSAVLRYFTDTVSTA